jgi:hypothetical protein
MVGQPRAICPQLATQPDTGRWDSLFPGVRTVWSVADNYSYNGFKAGPGHHARYFQLKGYDKEKRQAVVHKRRGAYTA